MKNEKVKEESLPAEVVDHSRIGKELDLFITHPMVGKGLPLLTPRGATMKRLLVRFIEDEELKREYEFTVTPSMANSELYKLSGHWDLYKENMFLMDTGSESTEEEDKLTLRPMTCPHQFLLYNRKSHTYKELPVRYAETSTLFRNEASGSMHGLIRIRQFTLSEGHIICRPDQLEEEFEKVLNLIGYVMQTLDMSEYSFRFSKWDPKNREKYIDNPSAWEESQSVLKKILDRSGMPYSEVEGEAAFYGPKLDIQMKNAWGKEDTAITIQIDYALAERFNMTYIDARGEKLHPVIIHRSSIGCYERTMALLLEKNGGRLPFWLSPQQVEIVTVNDTCRDFARSLQEQLLEAGVRSEVCQKRESLRKKIRSAQLMKIPAIVIIGEKEVESNSVSVRTLDGKVVHALPLDGFINQCLKLNATKTLNCKFFVEEDQ